LEGITEKSHEETPRELPEA